VWPGTQQSSQTPLQRHRLFATNIGVEAGVVENWNCFLCVSGSIYISDGMYVLSAL
jgi:hypothetical protein